ncbi:leucine-rich repeat containing [Micractinium conductrix]|uniref:Leucine-rich repeat containing n=1 Tax=Micractinium conductrix TaxID=554055 RepID=A0A2P6VSI5_9CHLO|nr:leucine-rich repeat containing [Micractinium conductrix]|eukprot:PSC77010.1 leucine-rich repeat containing [Micractinium conductrix]
MPPRRRAAARAASPSGLLALPDDLLLAVLSRISEEERIKVVPLACRRVHELLRRPSACWRTLVFAGRRLGDPLIERARLLAFLAWAKPRAAGLHDLRVDCGPPQPHDDAAVRAVAAPLHEVLLQAAPVLRRLDLKTAFTLNNHIIFEAGVRAQCTALTELHLLSERGITGVRLENLTALRRLNLVDDGDEPSALSLWSTLPPSLTWLGLTPAPMLRDGPDAQHDFRHRIPPCVLSLPNLQFLDVSESNQLAGLEEALPHLTALTGLALDHACLSQLPAQMSLLTRLRLLSLHGVLEREEDDEADLTPLSTLTGLRVLSLSECSRMHVLPPAISGLTGLRALHVEKGALQALPDDLHLPHCQILSIDWRVLLASHHVLPRLPRLQHLLLGEMWSEEDFQPQAVAAAAAAAANAEAVAGSLGRCAALRRFTVLVYPDAMLTIAAATLMLALPRRPGLEGLNVEALQSNMFFLTDSEGLEDEGVYTVAAAGSAAAGIA